MYDVLIVLAAIANIGSFLFQIKQEYKQDRRMVKEENKKSQR